MTLTDVSAGADAVATADEAPAGVFPWQGWCSWCTQHGEPITPGNRWPVHGPDAITGRVGGQIGQASVAARWGRQVAAWTDQYEVQRWGWAARPGRGAALPCCSPCSRTSTATGPRRPPRSRTGG